jgi:hypothetical protein
MAASGTLWWTLVGVVVGEFGAPVVRPDGEPWRNTRRRPWGWDAFGRAR